MSARTARRWVATTAGRVIFQQHRPGGTARDMGLPEQVMRSKDLSELVFESYRARARPTVQFLDQLKEIRLPLRPIGGVSIGAPTSRFRPRSRAAVGTTPKRASSGFQRAYSTGQITFGERYNKVIRRLDAPRTTTSPSDVSTMRKSRAASNPVFNDVDSGSRGSRDQIRPLAGMRGLMAKPQKKLTGRIGEIIESPIKSNFREAVGARVLISTHGARKVSPTPRSDGRRRLSDAAPRRTWRRTSRSRGRLRYGSSASRCRR